MAFEYDGKIYRNLEEQVDYNKDCINDLDLRVDTLEKQPAYIPMDLDLNTGIIDTTYDTTDGLSLTTQGTIKSNKGTDTVVVDYSIPIIGSNSISIDLDAANDKLVFKVDPSHEITMYSVRLKFPTEATAPFVTFDPSMIYYKPDASTSGRMINYPNESGRLVTSNSFKTINGNSIIGSGNITISGSIDADTLNGLLSGTNGVTISKSTSGDKVEISGSELVQTYTPTTGTYVYATHSTDQNLHIAVSNNSATPSAIVQRTSTGTIKAAAPVTNTDVVNLKYFKDNALASNNVKTLFGNQSIIGSGNIDLYLHKIFFRGQPSGGAPILCAFNLISSNNIQVDSLTDLKTLLGNSFMIAAPTYQLTNGNDFAVIGSNISETGIFAPRQLIEDDVSAPMMVWPSGDWVDVVTTV